MFVCRQGPQMEILIKAKQGNNPHFSFLNQNDTLYKFYRHVLAGFKNGHYKGYGPEPINNSGKIGAIIKCIILNHLFSDNSEDADHADSGSHYLHPSLLSTNSQQGVGFTKVKTLMMKVNRDFFLVVIIVNDFYFIKMWMKNGLNKNFIIIFKIGYFFFNCL